MIALYGHGMHNFVLREIEIGSRAARYEDSEVNTGWTAIDDVIYEREIMHEQWINDMTRNLDG